MKQLLMRTLIKPLAHRVGTASAVWLVAQGADSDLTNQLVQLLSAAVLVAVDLIFASRDREKVPQ